MAADFAARLDRLFDLVLTPPDSAGRRRPYTETEVSVELGRITGQQRESSRYIKDLRAGKRANPSITYAEQLAEVFAQFAGRMGLPGVESIDWKDWFLTYLVVPGKATDPHVERVERMHENLVAGVQERRQQVEVMSRQLGELSPEGLRQVQGFIAEITEELEATKQGRTRRGRRRGQ